MCTIVFIPTENDSFLLGHNRDESPLRSQAQPPQNIQKNDLTVKAPIDGHKGGSWIYTNNEQTVYLFNGGFEKHQHCPPYNRSRGSIVMEVLDYSSHESFIEKVNLQGVEPFTQVFIEHNRQQNILELVWDGQEKYVRNLEWTPFIRSSSTLYDAYQRKVKKRLFNEWLNVNNAGSILDFMQNTTFEIPTMLKRPKVETISTTLVRRQSGNNSMHYFDYLAS